MAAALLAAALMACIGSAAPAPLLTPTALPAPAEVAEGATGSPNTETDEPCASGPEFSQIFTVGNDTLLSPGESVTRTWRLRNTGRCAWGSGNQLVRVSGSLDASASSLPIPDALPGGEVDLSVKLVAPDAPGQYVSNWKFQDASGRELGPTLYAVLVVVAPAPPTATPTPIPPTRIPTVHPTSTPDTSGSPIASPAVRIDEAEARQIFQSGQQQGNHADVFAKVGDSITASSDFLTRFGSGRNPLGSYTALAPTIAYFRQTQVKDGNSFNLSPAAARGGWTSNDPLSPGSSIDRRCRRQVPLECEYDLIKPSVALIMLGTNDSPSNISSGVYETNLRQIVSLSIQHGVIPVLSTIPHRVNRDVGPANQIVARVAADAHIPLMDYWQLMENLPDHGLGDDKVHPSAPPNRRSDDLSASGLQYGYNLRNWLALVVLDQLRRDVLTR